MFLLIPHPPRPTLFPYTTLFRSATGQFSGVAPARIVDTRIGLGYPTALNRGSVTIQIAGRGGVPAMSAAAPPTAVVDRKSTRLNSSHSSISYAVFCLKKQNNKSP